jgi:hypothetical protein
MFRPWDQDPRAKWWAWVQHTTGAPLEPADEDAVLKVLTDTGLVRQPGVITREGSVIVRIVLRADSAVEAAVVASRIADVAHREAGTGAPCAGSDVRPCPTAA